MTFPTKSIDVSNPAQALIPRAFNTNYVVSTAKSFKKWKTCKKNKTCRIVAIVGIVLAVVTFLLIVFLIFYCVHTRAKRHKEAHDRAAYENPHMYPRKSNDRYDRDNDDWNRGGYKPAHDLNYAPGVIADEPEPKYEYEESYHEGYRGGYSRT